jgi:uncharacterized protein
VTVEPDEQPLLFNVAGLLGEPRGSFRDLRFAGVTIDLGGDLVLAEPVTGSVRAVRTNRGLVVTGHLATALAGTCGRCLVPVVVPLELDLDEEFLPTLDIATGQPVNRSVEPEVARLTDHHEMDLETPVREAIQLAAPIVPLCRPDCRGLCPVCGADQNLGPHGHPEAPVDPRLEALREFLPDTEA